MADKKKSLAMLALMGPAKKGGMEDDEEGMGDGEEEGREAYVDACADLLDAIKAGDPETVADALDAAMEARPA